MYAVLVVLYNCKVCESETINSLLNYWGERKDLHIDIINNGPFSIDEVALNIKGTFQYYQYLENKKLSLLYNEFLNRNNSEYYIFLDDDSVLSESYFISLESLLDNKLGKHFLLPNILSNGQHVYPKKTNMKSNIISNRSGVMSIGSGLAISNYLVELFIEKYGGVFDERFHFYGVDSSFFHRLNSLRNVVLGSYGGDISHSLSSQEVESYRVKAFRRLERSNDFGLTTRYYFDAYKCIRLVYFLLTNPFSLGRFKDLTFSEVINTMLSGAHYKDR